MSDTPQQEAHTAIKKLLNELTAARARIALQEIALNKSANPTGVIEEVLNRIAALEAERDRLREACQYVVDAHAKESSPHHLHYVALACRDALEYESPIPARHP